MTAETTSQLWDDYQALAVAAGDLWRQWRMQRGVARTDGTAGLIYGRAYAAQEAADIAYRAWLSAEFPAPAR